jgi:hypothetical protein
MNPQGVDPILSVGQSPENLVGRVARGGRAMPKVTIEVPEELVEAVSKVAAELEAGLAVIRSGKPLDFAELERRAAASA